ncbi:hypothetical protein [Algoriphagus sp. CAU 1675]|uniref:hypothetical protein n=1 Tax=Algoriphagus sp. CAU 1675 TaxID=3032597 RepID=UPI0023DAF6BA|nr:hypothetical protein [Algoriphagus sp. CAU 1675]MDF2156399.1 hypothetical protein [Algoriphagus sp. CAU 1675]
MSSKDPIFTPELKKVLKIFGLASFVLVLGLSFFNTKRAQNSGEDRTFRVTSSSRLYFLNLKAINYDREYRQDAGMTLFRHESMEASKESPSVDLVLILNPRKDEAYLYLEPRNTDWPLKIRVSSDSSAQDFVFQNGNKFDHLSYVKQLETFIRDFDSFELILDGKTVPIWTDENEKEGLNSVLDDFYRLLE